jgi:hypothetical protein
MDHPFPKELIVACNAKCNAGAIGVQRIARLLFGAVRGGPEDKALECVDSQRLMPMSPKSVP